MDLSVMGSKRWNPRFTSGASKLMPIFFASSHNTLSLSVSSISTVMLAQKNSAV
ncbi:hypothetical protein Y695_02474 [Hydrogenophaga sp. T4]|nr:hypothetical protein Y695_02474 [Hydrogenophaga sp. T4]